MKEILPSLLSPLEPKDHKYSHGVGLIIGSKVMSGAARLAGHAARRCELGHGSDRIGGRFQGAGSQDKDQVPPYPEMPVRACT